MTSKLPDEDGAGLVLVGGLHRSGTSFFARTIESAPGATGLRDTGRPQDEGQFVQDVFDNTPSGSVGRFAFHPASHLTEAAAEPDHGRRLLDAWSSYWDTGARLFVEKSPPNMLRTRYYDAVFPKAKQLMIVRSPIAVAMASQKWTYASVFGAVEHSLTAYEIMLRDLLRIEADWAVVRYESFVRDPVGVLAAATAAVGLDIGTVPAPEVRDGVNQEYADEFAGHRNPPMRRRRWYRRILPRLRRFGWELGDSFAEIQQIVRRYDHEMAALGYEDFDTLPDAAAVMGADDVRAILEYGGLGSRRPAS